MLRSLVGSEMCIRDSDLPANVKNINKKESFNKKCYEYYFDKALARNLI